MEKLQVPRRMFMVELACDCLCELRNLSSVFALNADKLYETPYPGPFWSLHAFSKISTISCSLLWSSF